MASSSPRVRSLPEAEVQHDSELGSIRRLTAANFPILERISIKRLVIEPGAIREPHWHANADELTYCLAGDLLVSVLDNADVSGAFTIGAGESSISRAVRSTTSRTSAWSPPNCSSSSPTRRPRTSRCTGPSAR